MIKSAAALVAKANASIEHVDAKTAISMHGSDDVLFVDLREDNEVAKGKIPGAVHVSRGLLEFIADPESPMHNQALSQGRQLIVYCGSGGRSALAVETLNMMGLDRTLNLEGGIKCWQESGGKISD